MELWLQTPCAGRVLWAFDAAHITALELHIGARLRTDPVGPGTAMTMLARLPSWMTTAKHRVEVLRGLSRLRERVLVPHGTSSVSPVRRASPMSMIEDGGRR